MSDELTQDSSSAGGGEEFSLGLTLPESSAPQAVASYRVLARKYRPSSFEDLIGQEPMVRTLANAFDLGRIHQAYILTGVRGVGKTTTARILARAFNYELPARDGRAAVTKPTIHMPELGVHCAAIIESRHVDVIEMDAASHTGIDDVRELIESARYRPVMARTKVYIIDEVHMLSKQAFNGLLKTLEEPPEHVRFLFATTEIDKVPVTVRSRCQRFDLRRIEAEVLIRHLAQICAKENVAIDTQALALIARAAEGSVRDALSLLDQAIAYGAGGAVGAESVRAMLGVADRARIVDLFEQVMKGDVAAALVNLKDQYDQGTDPGHVLVELAEFVHFVTRLKLAPQDRADAAVSEEEFTRAGAFAKALGMPVLTRAWQLIAKGIQDVKDSPRPLAAADMVLVRLAYAADLPTPDDVLRRIAATPGSHDQGRPAPTGSAGAGAAIGTAPKAMLQRAAAVAVAAQPQPSEMRAGLRLACFEDIVQLAQAKRDIQLKIALECDVRLVRFEEGSLEFSLVDGASPELAPILMRRLQEWTGARWMVAISRAEGAPTLKEQAAARRREQMTGVASDPLVRRVLERFPGAEIVAVRRPEPALDDPAAMPGETNDEIAYTDQLYTEDDL
ncbi:MAG TPA: DNA polymerase III subunit gamma/tau [Beijerinckiaceae bacterium]|nr:DNA polymerase III subunit gamma/tau [Beijerinckiaceae bacterium]